MAAIIDNPKGSTTRTDELGTYTHYHRLCNLCGVELTSRNRPADGSLRCKECMATKAREVWAARGDVPQVPSKPRRRLAEGHHVSDPDKQKVHGLLTAFLCAPTIKAYKDALLDALVDHELKERFRTL